MNEVTMRMDTVHAKLLSKGSRFYTGFFLPILITLLFTLCAGEAALAQCSSHPQYNIYIDQGNWTIPGSAFSDYIVSKLMGSPVDLYPNVAILMNDVMIENNQIYVLTRPPGIYKFYYTEISGSGNYNKVGYVVVSESANVVQGECCPTDCNWVCNNSFTEFPIYAWKIHKRVN